MVAPLLPPPPTPSPSSSYPPEYLHQNCYPPQVNVVLTTKHPWWMWWIGNLEIVKSGVYSVLAVYHIVADPPGPGDFIWVLYFLGTLGILTGFFQGIGLRSGLKSDDESVTLWYCKVWVACQVVFVIFGLVGMVVVLIASLNGTARAPELLLVFAASCYPVISFVAVKRYTRKLKQSEVLPPILVPNV